VAKSFHIPKKREDKILSAKRIDAGELNYIKSIK
jgi:hypothetical protein